MITMWKILILFGVFLHWSLRVVTVTFFSIHIMVYVAGSTGAPDYDVVFLTGFGITTGGLAVCGYRNTPSEVR